jgi:hypothetical protein
MPVVIVVVIIKGVEGVGGVEGVVVAVAFVTVVPDPPSSASVLSIALLLACIKAAVASPWATRLSVRHIAINSGKKCCDNHLFIRPSLLRCGIANGTGGNVGVVAHSSSSPTCWFASCKGRKPLLPCPRRSRRGMTDSK